MPKLSSFTTSNVVDDIKKLADALPQAEKRVAKWLLSQPADVIDLSLAAAANQAQVSEPTVIRFCRRLGLKGYRELKLNLAVSLQTRSSTVSVAHQDVDPRDDAVTAAEKVLGSAAKTMLNAHQQAGRQPFEAAIQRMSQARQWIFVGLGASGFVAQDAKHKFFRLGVPSSTALDAQTILQHAAIGCADDVFIAISHTGKWPDLVRAMQHARKQGSTIIALTQTNTALAEQATILFETSTSEDTNVFTPMSSRLAQLATLDALQVGVALALGQSAADKLRLSKAVIQI